MERAGRSFATWSGAKVPLSSEELALAAWPAAVGRRLAGRTKATALVRERLVVEVEDALWQRNLHLLRHQILSKLGELLGANAPREVEFRIGIPRRPPQREVPAAMRGPESIADPVMNRIYRMSRRKAGA
jgi:hypothetical protein